VGSLVGGGVVDQGHAVLIGPLGPGGGAAEGGQRAHLFGLGIYPGGNTRGHAILQKPWQISSAAQAGKGAGGVAQVGPGHAFALGEVQNEVTQLGFQPNMGRVIGDVQTLQQHPRHQIPVGVLPRWKCGPGPN